MKAWNAITNIYTSSIKPTRKNKVFFFNSFNILKKIEEKKIKKKAPWTELEKKMFEEALLIYKPKDWKAIASYIKTRTAP